MEEAAVTFVIPVKDRSDYLREALVSLLMQTISNWKCIVVDDYSSEDIASVVAELADERIKYVKNTHKPGVSGARNTGNELVDTEWIALADSDDINLPRRLEVSLDLLKNHPETDVLYSNLYVFEEGTWKFKIWKHGDSYQRSQLYHHNFIANNTAMYRKAKALELGGYNEELASAEDYDMWLKFADVHANFGYIEEPLALYRRHGEQFTGSEGKEMVHLNAVKVREAHAKFL